MREGNTGQKAGGGGMAVKRCPVVERIPALESYFSPHFSMCTWYMMMVTVWCFLVLTKYSVLLSILILNTTPGGRYYYSCIPYGKTEAEIC